MKHWFLDTNVLIDFLTDRQPFASAANTIFCLAYAGEVQLYVASLSFNTAFYLMRRSFATRSDAAGASQLAQQQLMQIKSLLTVVAVDDNVLSQALQAGFNDFEDAIQLFAAQSIPAIELVVTRNSKDFKFSRLPVVDPAAALESLGYQAS